MAMFDDPKMELKKLEQQLLKDEEWLDRELAAARALMGEEPVKKAKPAQTRKNPAQTKQNRPSGTPRSGSGTAPVRNYANNYGRASKVVASNYQDYDLDEYEKKHPKKGVKGLVILAVLETLGIVAVVAYWLRFLL